MRRRPFRLVLAFTLGDLTGRRRSKEGTARARGRSRLIRRLVGLALVLVAACSESGAGKAGTAGMPNEASSATTPEEVGATSPSALVPEPGTVGLYARVHLSENDTYLHEYGISLESDTFAIVYYNPDLDQAALIEEYTDPSYADISITPYTAEGRVFLAWKAPGAVSDYGDLYEQAVPSGSPHPLLSVCCMYVSSFAVIGDRVYGFSYPDLVLFEGDTEPTVLWSAEDTFLTLHASAGRLYATGSKFIEGQGYTDRLTVFRFEEVRTEFELLAEFDAPEQGYSAWLVAFDEVLPVAYLTRVSEANGQLELYRWDLSGDPELVHQEAVPGMSNVVEMDAHDGVVALGWYDNQGFERVSLYRGGSEGLSEVHFPFNDDPSNIQLISF